MKPIHVFLMIPFSLPLLLEAQQINKKMNPRDSIVIDFRSDTGFYLWKLKYNTPYVVKLKNVNRFAYKDATATQNGTDFNTDIPSILKGIKLPGFITGAVSKEFDSLAAFQPPPEEKGGKHQPKDPCLNVTACSPMPDITVPAKKVKASFAELKKAVAAFTEMPEMARQLERLQKDVSDPFPLILQKKRDLLRLSGVDSSGDLPIQHYYDSLIKKAEADYKIMEAAAEEITGRLQKTLGSSRLKEDTTRLLQCLVCRTCSDAHYREILELLNSRRACARSFSDQIDSVEQLTGKAGEAVAALQKAKKEGKIDQAQWDYDLLSSENFSLVLDEFLAKKDIHEMTFTLSSADPLPSEQRQKRTIKLTGITTGGMKVDFSTGVFFNVGNEAFLGPKYYYVTIDSNTRQIEQTHHANKAMLSVGALMHVYWRMYSWVKPGLSAGVSLTTGFDQVNLHGGLSAIIGKPGTKNRVIVSTGITLRESSLLDNRYQINTPYHGLPDDIPLSKSFPQTGWFLALSYNFTAGGN